MAVMERLLRPILAEKPVAEIDRIGLEYISLTEQGKTSLSYHEYRQLPRIRRQALLREAANG